MAERGRAEPERRLDRVRDAERAEGRLERARASARATGRRARPAPGGVPARSSASTSSPTSSSAPRVPAPSRKRTAPSSGGAGARCVVVEERALEVRERGRATYGRARRAAPRCGRPRARARSSAVRRSDANAGRPGSYGSETVTSARPASASSSAHSRGGQVLEAVGEDRLAVPGVEVARQPLDRVRAGAARDRRARARSSSAR